MLVGIIWDFAIAIHEVDRSFSLPLTDNDQNEDMDIASNRVGRSKKTYFKIPKYLRCQYQAIHRKNPNLHRTMKFSARPKKSLSPIKIELLLIALLLGIICVISWPGMTAPRILDDLDQLPHVEKFTSWKDCFSPDAYGLFRPLKNFIFYILRDSSLFTWHACTLAIYLCAVLALYGLFRRLTNSPVWAFIGALLWASCPTQVSTVVWMSAINLSLAMAFTCVCIIFHDLSQEKLGRNIGWSVLACISLFFAQVSYETAVAAPALCVLVDLLRKRPLFSRAAMLRYSALACVTIGYLVLRAHFGSVHSIQAKNLGFPPDTQAWQLTLSAPWFLWKHFSMWLMPAGRIEFCSAYIWGVSASTFELVAAWVWLLAVVGVIFLSWKRLPMVAIGLLWFLAASFPPSNFIPIWSGPIEDYYLVFPGVGLVLVLVGCARALIGWAKQGINDPTSHRLLIGFGLIIIGIAWRSFCIPLFWMQANLWNKPAELYLIAETSRPHQFQLQASAARELMLMGKLEEAKVLAYKSHQSGPWDPMSTMILGYIAYQQGDFTNAEKQLRIAIDKSSPNTPIHNFSILHLAATFQKQNQECSKLRDTLLPLLQNQEGTYHLEAIRMLIDCYLKHDQPKDALRATRNAIKLHPKDPQFSKILANIEALHPGILTTD